MADASSEQIVELEELLKDPINRVIERHWSRALDSQADDYVSDDGTVGPIDEATYYRYLVNSIRITRQELDELYGRGVGRD